MMSTEKINSEELENERRPRSLFKLRIDKVWIVVILMCVGYWTTISKYTGGHIDPVSFYGNIDRKPIQLQDYEKEKDPLYNPIGLPSLEPSHDHLKVGSRAMVGSDVPQCSKLGKEILLQGGNAADAAITVALCIGSINSQSSGIGGGAFILSKQDTDVISIDAREMAPQGAFKDMYKGSPLLSKIGGLANGIPGELKGLDELYRRHGSGNLTWKQLFEPVITLNREGFVCSQVLATAIRMEYELVLSKLPPLKEIWGFIFTEDGELIKEGDIVKRPEFADTLELIANNGSSAIFYDPLGPIATALSKTSQGFHGILTAQDFAAYKVVVEEPISVDIDIENEPLRLYSTSGVSCGLALAAGLKFFDRVHTPNDNDGLKTHKLIESFKWLALVRSNLGDFHDNPEYKNELMQTFTGEDWIDQIISNGSYSDNTTFCWKNYNPKYELTEPKGTAHFSIIDEDGNSISMTTTVNLLFGSMIVDPTTGIILNNEMDDFSQPNVSNAFGLEPSIYNFIAPFKRPMSSTAPSFLVNKKTGLTEFLIGAAGGSRIPTAVLQAIYRTYYQKLSLLETIAFPRMHHQLIPEYVMVDNLTIFSDEHSFHILESLRSRGHDISESGSLTAMNGIQRVGKVLHGVSDFWRKRGEADGY